MTDTTLTVDQAEAAHRQLLDQLAAGDPIDPLDLVRSEAAKDLARLKAEHQARLDAEAAEDARLARIDELRQEARELDALAIGELYTTAVKALEKLATAADQIENEGGRIAKELERLRPWPSDVATNVRRPDGTQVGQRAKSLAGVRLHQRADTHRLSFDMVLAAVHAVVPRAGDFAASTHRTQGIRPGDDHR